MFELDGTGAGIKSKSETTVVNPAVQYAPKWLVFDKPFLVCLRKKGSEAPYLAMWIANAELMQKWDSKRL